MISSVVLISVFGGILIGGGVFTGIWYGMDLGSSSSDSGSNSSNLSVRPPDSFKRVIYLESDNNGLAYSWGTPFTDYLTNISLSGYNVAIISFYLPSAPNSPPLPAGAAMAWSSFISNNQTPTIPPGLTVLLSVGGETYTPNSTNFTEATALGTAAGKFAAQNKFDGLDFDIENINYTHWAANIAVPWLVELTNSARASFIKESKGVIPIITHAPVAPYFSRTFTGPNSTNYADFARIIGHNVSWYNIQFYNQGPYRSDNKVPDQPGHCQIGGVGNNLTNVSCCYTGPISLVSNSSVFCPAIFGGSSVTEIANLGIPWQKIIVGKPVREKDANGGQIFLPDTISSLMGDTYYGGIMGWQWDGTINTSCRIFYGAPCV